jgi:hypothetical protein
MRLVVVFSMCVAATSFAQTERSAKKTPVQTIDLTGTTLKGDIDRPVMEFTVLPERPLFKRLIQIRGSFANELHQSVDALR